MSIQIGGFTGVIVKQAAVTANNGLTETANNIQLGGDLINSNTDVNFTETDQHFTFDGKHNSNATLEFKNLTAINANSNIIMDPANSIQCNHIRLNGGDFNVEGGTILIDPIGGNIKFSGLDIKNIIENTLGADAPNCYVTISTVVGNYNNILAYKI